LKLTLAAARVNKNLTQKQAAELIGVTRDTVGNWERRKSYPDAIIIRNIEAVYGVQYDDIIFLPGDNA